MNRNLQLLQSLYSSTSGKYLKFKSRFDKAVSNGRFYKLNRRKQSSLISRLKKLFERLKSLQTQLRLAGAGAALALTLSMSNPVQGQSSLGPFVRNDNANPLPAPVIISRPRPAVVDIDDDGDLDVFIGNSSGYIQFFRNDSPQDSVTLFTEVTGEDNPFDGVDVGYEAAIAFADVDGNGTFDALLGNETAQTFYYENTGSESNPNFIERTGSSQNPFDGIEGTGNIYGFGNAIPTFVDLDGDLDMDLVIGSSYVNADGTPMQAVRYYENDGGDFVSVSDHAIEAALAYFDEASVTFADIDDDGDLDAFVGSAGSGYIHCYKQGTEGVFTAVYGAWDPVLKTGNPFNNHYFSKYSTPVAADFDGDGDLDFIVGTRRSYCYSCAENSNIRYYENTDGSFTLENKTELNRSPFAGIDVGSEAVPVFVDLDGDGDLDALIGAKYSNPDVFVYLNKEGRFFEAPDHPIIEVFDDLGFLENVVPVFIDIDNDNDLDLFVCEDQGVEFLRNNEGDYEEEATLFPTLNGSIAGDLSLAFIDVDNDGDLDAFFGNDRYNQPRILYFENTGSATSPTFTSATPPEPFDTNLFEYNPNVSAVDLDNDGDTDLAIAETYYNGFSGAGFVFSKKKTFPSS